MKAQLKTDDEPKAPSFARVESLLAMLLLRTMGDATVGEKAVTLTRAGFGRSEIATLVGVPAAVIGQRLYEARKAKPKKARKVKG